jgi:DNA-binding transcriptional MerR regulator
VGEISKKDLLTETGISYGQLYRWKREGLIPEEWFIKRSAFTGQETFFPRTRMLGRVRAILALKDSLSLEQIREQLEGMPVLCNVREALLTAVNGDTNFVDALRQPTHFHELPLTTLAPALGLCEWLTHNGAMVGAEVAVNVEALARTEVAAEAEASRAKMPRDERLRLVDEAFELTLSSPAGHVPATATLFASGNAYHLCIGDGTEPPRFGSGVKVLVHLRSADVVERYRVLISGIVSSKTA